MSTSQASKLNTLLQTTIDKLYHLRDISTSRSWDYSLPTITSHRAYTDRLNFHSDESFFHLFKDVNGSLPYRLLKHAGVFESGNEVVLFGGCLLDIVLGREYSIRDYDLRLVGEKYVNDEDLCVAKAKEFVTSIFQFMSEENERVDERNADKAEAKTTDAKCNIQEIVVSRARSTVSVHVPAFGKIRPSVYQLTFAPAKSIQDLLQGCQPHCTRLAVKDGEIIMDHMARFSIENTAVVMDVPSFVNYYCGEAPDEDEEVKRESSGRTIDRQFARFMKYHQEKGFDIILPELNMEQVPRRNLEYNVVEVLPLPCMTVIYRAVDNKSIMTVELKQPKALSCKRQDHGLIGSYDSSPTPNVGEAIHHNIRCLVNSVYDSFRHVAKGERWDHVFDFVPALTPRMVKKSYETVFDDLQSGNIPLSRLTGYFSVTSPHEVVEKLIVEPLKKYACAKGCLPKPFLLDKDVLKSLVDLEVSQLIETIECLRESMVRKGLDHIVCQYAKKVSNEEEVYSAIYGSCGIRI